MQQRMPDVAQRCATMFMNKVTLRVKRLIKRKHNYATTASGAGARFGV